jgi:hypothetical protein
VTSNQTLASTVKELSSYDFGKVFLADKVTGKFYPLKDVKMTNVNKFLRNNQIRQLLWEELEIPKNVEFPIFPSEILYGILSERTHVPPLLREVFVPSNAENEYKVFFKHLASNYNLRLQEFSEEEASAAAAIFDNDKQK